MRRPIKPFAVEKRRSGRRIPLPDLLERPRESAEASEPRPLPPPPADEDGYLAALRAADALFNKPQAADPSREAARDPDATGHPADQRRILPTLAEEDPIQRMLAQEEQDAEQDRRRRPRQPRERSVRAASAAPQLPLDLPAEAAAEAPAPRAAGRIPGYVRGLIFARYARNDAVRPGEYWRKRARKPAW